MNIKDLKNPIPFQWKVQSISKDGKTGSFVAYIDARDVMNRLDEVVGEENWQDKYEFSNGKLIAGIGIKVTDWIWKYDTGSESEYDSEKGQFSDAFKRAAVKWGVGRFLYDLEIKWLPIGDHKRPIDANGYEVKDVSGYINSLDDSSNKVPTKTVKRATAPIKGSSDASEGVLMKSVSHVVPHDDYDKLRDAIRNLLIDLGEAVTPEAILRLTKLEAIEKNFKEIREKLEIIKEEKKGV